MIQTLNINEIYRVFEQTYPLDKISLSQFRKLKPWNLIKAYRETCLCRTCEAFRLYVKALNIIGKLLKDLLQSDENLQQQESIAENPGGEDAEASAEASAAASAAASLQADDKFEQLVGFCKLDSKSEMVNRLVCAPCLMSAEPACVDGSCASCGFKKMWSEGVRPKLVDNEGKLQPGVSSAWEQEVRYEVIKSSKSTPSDGSSIEDKDTLRERRTATVIEFLDAFEDASKKFPAHRHLVVDAKNKVRRLLAPARHQPTAHVPPSSAPARLAAATGAAVVAALAFAAPPAATSAAPPPLFGPPTPPPPRPPAPAAITTG